MTPRCRVIRQKCAVAAHLERCLRARSAACVLQLLTEEFYSLQTSAEKRAAELRAQNAQQASRLQAYELLEQELDQATVQAAEGKTTLQRSPRGQTGRRPSTPRGARVFVCRS